MSDVEPDVTWMLDDLDESIDVQEDDDQVFQVRDHIVIKIHRQMPSSEIPSRLSIGDVKSSITYSVGGTSKTNNPAGTGKFICVGDGVTPKENPGDFAIRRQTWEYYGPWKAAPAEWNV